jgi:hypothetical protein
MLSERDDFGIVDWCALAAALVNLENWTAACPSATCLLRSDTPGQIWQWLVDLRWVLLGRPEREKNQLNNLE